MAGRGRITLCGLTVSTLLLLLLLLASPTNSQDDYEAQKFARFKTCVERCSRFNMDCNDDVKDLWNDFYGKKKKIMRHLRKCCLRGENRGDSSPEDSFATCARMNCGAMLWGYVTCLSTWSFYNSIQYCIQLTHFYEPIYTAKRAEYGMAVSERRGTIKCLTTSLLDIYLFFTVVYLNVQQLTYCR